MYFLKIKLPFKLSFLEVLLHEYFENLKLDYLRRNIFVFPSRILIFETCNRALKQINGDETLIKASRLPINYFTQWSIIINIVKNV